MTLPVNRFKARLGAGTPQIGIWNTIGGPVVPEILALCGFDWVLIDTEHSPMEVTDALRTLQVLAGHPAISPVVRPAWNDPVLIKRHLDQGAQTLLVPYVETPDEARAAVAAMRYPPAGMRGVAGLTRATGYGTVAGYAERAAGELCLIVQVETAPALDRIEEIAAVEGVDGVFIGPADLAASMGLPGGAGRPEVVAAILDGLARLKSAGRPSGLLTPDAGLARRYIDAGAAFVAVGVDAGLLVSAARQLRQQF
ncbi:MAG: HpcH/HpaI aldolase/citrate lyase family protein [Sneathiellaceae bacterium]